MLQGFASDSNPLIYPPGPAAAPIQRPLAPARLPPHKAGRRGGVPTARWGVGVPFFGAEWGFSGAREGWRRARGGPPRGARWFGGLLGWAPGRGRYGRFAGALRVAEGVAA